MKNFNFYCDINIKKATDSDGNEIYRLGGIASTMDKDSDGEFLDPSGFEIKDFVKSGVVNWHHGSTESPRTIIGEPHKAEIRKDGFYVECDLYPSSNMAREVYGLAEVMQKDSKSRKLGYSIEGTVIERDLENPMIVKKAKITGLAITHMPKNPKTFAQIIKGETTNNLSEEKKKSLSTVSGAALVEESVDGSVKNLELQKKPIKKSHYQVKNFSQKGWRGVIFNTFPNITIEKANKVYQLFNKIQKAMDRGQISSDNLQKAMDTLGLGDYEANPFLEKGMKGDDGSYQAPHTKDSTFDNVDGDTAHMNPARSTKKAGTKKNMGMDNDMDKGDYEEDDMMMKKKKKGIKDPEMIDGKMDDGAPDNGKMKKNMSMKKTPMNKMPMKKNMNMKKGEEASSGRGAVLILKKAIAAASQESFGHVQALGTLVKATLEQNQILKSEIETLRKSEEGLLNDVGEIKGALEVFLKVPQKRRSITKGYSKKESFQKSEESTTSGETLSMSNNYGKVLELVDNAAFAKGGYDESFAKATTSFEANKTLPADIISRLKSEYNVNIVN